MSRPLKGKEPLSETKPISLTPAQVKLWESKSDTADYLRRCLETRGAGTPEERRVRANDLRLKAQELMREANELEEQVEADELIHDSRWDEIAREFDALERYKLDRDMNMQWLCGRFEMTPDQATQFLQYKGDGKGQDRE